MRARLVVDAVTVIVAALIAAVLALAFVVGRR